MLRIGGTIKVAFYLMVAALLVVMACTIDLDSRIEEDPGF